MFEDFYVEYEIDSRRYNVHYYISNKGYGTSKHIEAIEKLGIIDKIHRKSFVKKIVNKIH